MHLVHPAGRTGHALCRYKKYMFRLLSRSGSASLSLPVILIFSLFENIVCLYCKGGRRICQDTGKVYNALFSRAKHGFLFIQV